MTPHDLFEQRAASAGAALRAAFLVEGDASGDASAPGTPDASVLHRAVSRPGGRRPAALAAAAAALVVAVSVGAVAVSGRNAPPPDLLTPPDGRQTAELSPPYLNASGALPDRPVQSVQDFPVPFTFSTPPRDPAARAWRYYNDGELFDLGNGVSGMTVIAPTRAYDPRVAWKGQTSLVPAPTDAAGWTQWLVQTRQVDVAQRRELRIGGASATRLTLDVGDLPSDYEGCGGGRACVAIAPMLEPELGSTRIGAGPQAGIDDETAELTVIELEERAVLVLSTGEPDDTERWLATLQSVVESLRFA